MPVEDDLNAQTLTGNMTGKRAYELKEARRLGDLSAVWHEIDYAPKERSFIGAGVGGGRSTVLRFVVGREGAFSGTDGRGIPIRLDDVLEQRRARVIRAAHRIIFIKLLLNRILDPKIFTNKLHE